MTFALTLLLFSGIDSSLVGSGPYLSNPAPPSQRSSSPTDSGDRQQAQSPLMTMAVAVALKFMGLFVMGYVASLVATKGIQFVYAPATSTHPAREKPNE